MVVPFVWYIALDGQSSCHPSRRHSTRRFRLFMSSLLVSLLDGRLFQFKPTQCEF